ncbi:EAL domain-containing protein [Anabaena cylindrica FACHB-243]|uniref:Response regulator receiver modulated diguanylate cyclase/phosphodiesterase n=2 Tax=Anabaena TaxID=1163 RepID=K9ZL71_ANACC|nr:MULTISPECIES: EAL domain-containing protein [Anabaena]AFZ59080.1 response regulator receiver modulated diguanylate cyclase/phosphodiesterase [Anabaena cylindrica PCC 7122]MBD2420581.1 EAL domain-containing protein [Anabaena cylindrica FACHB-243]MBY5284446.1 EAL domain-containing protein [Anabaena sp. CCAP 1446/1C]MBY5308989.1 EAL domain-containing protein [Anabaena sp. CCAP 1446/1C]MCM2408539.1 EAL domain-containing protein [Anabaena sp. CCAP 1446/1C]
MTEQIKILIVEDNLDDAELMVLELEAANYKVVYQRVDTIEAMIAALESQEWDVILTDYSMPQFSAVAALSLIKLRKLDTPFIVVSGSIGEEIAVKLMRDGAHDYLLKHNLTRLAPAIERELREAKVRCERKQALEKVKFLAFYDELTGLPNRNAVLNILRKQILKCYKFAVLFINIDQYRKIKYGFGHIKSEQLLIEVANRLQASLRPGDYLAKMGKDEFILILGNINHVSEAETHAIEMHRVIDPPFALEGFVIYASITIGVVDSSLGFDEPEEFLRAAETANYTAKEQGLQYPTVVYNRSMQTRALERLQMETELRQAISKQQLQLFYQPIISLHPYKVVGFEALIRWHHPEQGWISPIQFIPLAEQTGLIIPLGEWILENACQQLTIWQNQFLDDLPLSLSINLSGVQLNEIGVVPNIIHHYQSLNLHQITLKLEITESTLMNNTQTVIASLEEFRAAGIQISIDDFGTGYSSLSYLRDLPVDTLKIDRSFVSRIDRDEQNLGIVQAIITLAHTLGLDVIAEGVETVAQMKRLRSLGCKYGQGYLFSQPMPSSLLSQWLQKANKEIGFAIDLLGK